MTDRARLCVLTAEGRGAIAVVRIWGPDALAIADATFRPHRGVRLAETPRGRPRVGRVGAGLGDEVVAVVLGFAHEFPEVEIQCHGGPAPLALVVEALISAGAVRVRPEDWSGRNRCPRVRHEAEVDLPHAPTARAAEILMDQAEGALEEELARLFADLEADPAGALAGLDRLRAWSQVGVRLVTGWRVVLAGRPNVGKSRLLNALAGFDRAIVDPTPGTTRDVVTARTALDGWPVELADTAGLRDPADPIEAEGIARARSRQETADLVLLVLDRSEPLGTADDALIRAHPLALRLASKVDLPAAWDAPGWDALPVSAARGDGLEGLIHAIAGRLVPDPPPPAAAVPFRTRQVDRIDLARRRLAEGRPDRARRALASLIAPAP